MIRLIYIMGKLLGLLLLLNLYVHCVAAVLLTQEISGICEYLWKLMNGLLSCFCHWNEQSETKPVSNMTVTARMLKHLQLSTLTCKTHIKYVKCCSTSRLWKTMNRFKQKWYPEMNRLLKHSKHMHVLSWTGPVSWFNERVVSKVFSHA